VNDERCLAFERWLDEGEPPAPSGALLAHARECARCATALGRARALDVLLAGTLPAAAPAGFTGAVLARLDAARAPARAPTAAPAWPDPMPLVARIAMEPAVILALVLAGLCLWRFDQLRRLGMALASATSAALPHGTPAAHAWVYALGFAPVVAWATVWLYGWTERRVEHLLPRGLARP
jgi:hypothetical protein